jgi:shikimate kinase
MTIRQIFAEEGEAAFRDREQELLEDLCRRRQHVIATGGGVVLRDVNRERLKRAGFCVWLSADAHTIWLRLQADATTAERRPPLTVGGRDEVEQLLRIRTPLYRVCADLTVDTVGRSPADITDEIVRSLGWA